jgi:hypothetical protein
MFCGGDMARRLLDCGNLGSLLITMRFCLQRFCGKGGWVGKKIMDARGRRGTSFYQPLKKVSIPIFSSFEAVGKHFQG